jgi:hypothetical protein
MPEKKIAEQQARGNEKSFFYSPISVNESDVIVVRNNK